jgi:hypothetical protein
MLKILRDYQISEEDRIVPTALVKGGQKQAPEDKEYINGTSMSDEMADIKQPLLIK